MSKVHPKAAPGSEASVADSRRIENRPAGGLSGSHARTTNSAPTTRDVLRDDLPGARDVFGSEAGPPQGPEASGSPRGAEWSELTRGRSETRVLYPLPLTMRPGSTAAGGVVAGALAAIASDDPRSRVDALKEAEQAVKVLIDRAPEDVKKDPEKLKKLVDLHPEAFFAPTFHLYFASRGDASRTLEGADLENEIGTAMPELGGPDLESMKDGMLYGAKARQQINPVARQIRAIHAERGTSAASGPEVSVLPLMVSTKKAHVQVPLFRVEGKNGREFVDHLGRRYRSFEDWRKNNELPSGKVTYPEVGRLQVDAAGRPKIRTENTAGKVDSWGERLLAVGDAGSILGGFGLGAAVLLGLGAGSMLLPVAGIGLALYGAGRSVAGLKDRAAHDETMNPVDDCGARMEWLGLGSNMLAVAALGTSFKAARAFMASTPRASAGAAAAIVASQVADTVSITDQGVFLARNWEKLPVKQRLLIGSQIAFFGGLMGHQARQLSDAGGFVVNKLYDFNRIRAQLDQNARLFAEMNDSREQIKTLSRDAGNAAAENNGAEAGEQKPFISPVLNDADLAPQPSSIQEGRAKLESIRNGPAGRIRSSAELTNSDVALSLNAQLQQVTTQDVQQIVDGFEPNLQTKARAVLARASGFGNMESLNVLRMALEPHLAAGRRVYMPGRGSLPDNFAYLERKGAFGELAVATRRRVPVADDITSDTVIILDSVVLQQLRTDRAFAHLVANTDCTLINPRGFNSGINMFNGSSVDAIAKRTGVLVKEAQRVVDESGGLIAFDDAVTQTLDLETYETVSAVDVRLWGRVESVDPATDSKATNASNAYIAEKLSGNAGISPEELAQALERVPPERQDYARELLAREANVFSSRRLAAELYDHHTRIMNLAAERGLAAEDVYFLVPGFAGQQKSFGMIAMAHREATGTPIEQYLDGYDPRTLMPIDIKETLGPDRASRAMLVLLDDVAGSGMTLKDIATETVIGSAHEGPLVVSPVLSTTQADESLAGLTQLRSNVLYEPRQSSPELHKKDFYTSLKPADQEALTQFMGTSGWAGGTLSVAFPYMAPDNNNSFFGDLVAKFFIVNRARAASKVGSFDASGS